MEECIICAEKFTAVARKKINCPKCNQDICIKCVQRFLLNTMDEPHCMNCKQGFSRYFLQTNLTKTFIDKDYAKHRAEILWKREESYLPAAQVKAERIVRSKALEKDEHIEVKDKIKEIRTKIEVLEREMTFHKKILSQHEEDVYRLSKGMPTRKELAEMGGEEEIDNVVRKQFTRKCTNENCNGWLSSAWKCGICENYTCSKCFIIKGKKNDEENPHICKKEDIETAELIKKDTKPCPQCGEAIQRSAGCSVMFCVSCHTPFDWDTLEIIKKGNIHNPHYIEWRNAMGTAGTERAFGDVPCGGIPDDEFIWRLLKTPARDLLSKIWSFINHVSDYELRKYQEDAKSTEDLRIKFLLNETTKDDIQRYLQVRERKNERNRSIRDVLNTFRDASAEELRIIEQIIIQAPFDRTNRDSIEGVPEFLKAYNRFIESMELLRDFINKSLEDVSKAYGCTVPYILGGWTMITHKS